MPLVFGKSLYLHTLFFTVISLKTYRIDMSKILIIDDEAEVRMPAKHSANVNKKSETPCPNALS